MVAVGQFREQLPVEDLPFRLISGTIGEGAYAFIRKACPHDAFTPVIAVKFIHKEHAFKRGKIKPKQLHAERALHEHVGKHQNVIQYLEFGEDQVWAWIAMELADGDLFDKIEADMGVGEDIAHFYFTQLIAAVGYMHSRGVAHRDIKPENILVADGDLKLADFGMAVLFGYKGEKKLCQTVCGSPPYMAPEVVPTEGFSGHKTQPYEANIADIWSCGVVLFVLLVGNTPWDEPTKNSYEFNEYIEHGSVDELWAKIPHDALSLLRGILRIKPKSRFSLEDIRRHPWFTRRNPLLSSNGQSANPVALATKMIENLRIDFDMNPVINTAASQRPAAEAEAMDLDDVDAFNRVAMTQPETPASENLTFDWERPARGARLGISASQPVNGATQPTIDFFDRLRQDVAMSQFSTTPQVPLTVTQAARKFKDIMPQQSLARFLSFMEIPLLLKLVSEACERLGIPVVAPILKGTEEKISVNIKTQDQRGQPLVGAILLETIDIEVTEVRFLKRKGDPVEWRRLFKKVAVLCKDGILRPG